MSLIDLAHELAGELSPACARIEIAGSIRRGASEPKDIEIVAMPRLERVAQMKLFHAEGEAIGEPASLLEPLIDQLVCGRDWEFDPEVRRNGPRYKRLRHRAALNAQSRPAVCDLFIATPRTWGIVFTLRTGPADFSKALVSLALRQGKFVEGGLLHGHRRQYVRNPRTGENEPQPCLRGENCSLIIPTLEEAQVFKALGLPCPLPAERGLGWLAKTAKEDRE